MAQTQLNRIYVQAIDATGASVNSLSLGTKSLTSKVIIGGSGMSNNNITLETAGITLSGPTTIPTGLSTGVLNVTGNTTLVNASLVNVGVTGNSYLTNVSVNVLTVAGRSTLQNVSSTNLGVTGTTTLATTTTGGLTASSLSVTGNESVTGTLAVTGQTTLGNTSTTGLTSTGLTVNGNETVTGTLGVTGQTTLGITGTGALTAASIYVSGNETVAGTLGVTGATTLGVTGTGALTVTGNETVSGTLGVTGQTTLGVTGTGTLTVTGNETVSGTLGVTGVTTLGVTGTGALTAASLTVTGNESVSGTLGVTGATTLGVTGTGALTAASSSITGNETVGGTLGVTGQTTLQNASVTGTLAVRGNCSINNVSVTGTLMAAGATTINTTGTATTTIGSATSATTVGGTLGVTGIATLANTSCSSFGINKSSFLSTNDAGGNPTLVIAPQEGRRDGTFEMGSKFGLYNIPYGTNGDGGIYFRQVDSTGGYINRNLLSLQNNPADTATTDIPTGTNLVTGISIYENALAITNNGTDYTFTSGNNVGKYKINPSSVIVGQMYKITIRIKSTNHTSFHFQTIYTDQTGSEYTYSIPITSTYTTYTGYRSPSGTGIMVFVIDAANKSVVISHFNIEPVTEAILTSVSCNNLNVDGATKTRELILQSALTSKSVGLRIRQVAGTANYISCGKYTDVGDETSGTDGGVFVVKNSGNVGIGTSAPVAPLHVANGNTTIRIGPTNYVGIAANNTSFALERSRHTIDFSGYRDTGDPRIGARIGVINKQTYGTSGAQNATQSTEMFFSTYPPNSTGVIAADGSIERMRITDTGNVGLGTSTPGYKLDVAGSTNVGTLRAAFATLYSNTGDSDVALQFTRNGVINIGISAEAAPRLRIGTTGSTGNDVQILSLATNGPVYSNGGILTNSNPSDGTLKKNIRALDVSIDQLNPVQYEWINPKMGVGIKYGFLANEVIEIFPNICSTWKTLEEDEEDGIPKSKLGMDTVSFIPIIVSAMKKMKLEYETRLSNLQEVDRQLQAEKQKVADLQLSLAAETQKTLALETTLASVLARLDALERAS